MDYVYRPRSTADWDRRVNQSGGNFIHFISDAYRLFTPVKGENLIRILPPSTQWVDAPHAGLDLHVHYGVGPAGQGGSVICLNLGAPQIGVYGKPCPICHEHARAMRARDEVLTRELRPVKRVVTFVLNRKDESQGPLIWAMPFTVDRDIGSISRNRTAGGYYAIDHPLEGYDIYFDRQGEGQFTKYTGEQLASNPTPVADRHIAYVEAHPIPEVLIWRDYDEVKRLWEGRSVGEVPEEDEPVSERPPRNGGERPPQLDDGPRVSTRHNSTDRPTAEEIDDDAPWEGQRSERRPPYRRPTGVARASDNGPTATPPANEPPPSSAGNARADEVRARFMKRRT